MALNFDGLGIGFEFDDGGAQEGLKGVTNSTDNLWNTMRRTSSAMGRVTSRMKRSFGTIGQMGRSSMGGVALAIGNMTSAAMDPQLDTAYSSMYAGFNKSFSAMTVGINATTKEMKEARRVIGGVAFGLNEDMDSAAESWAAFRKQNIDLTKVMGSKGLKGAMKDLIRITSVFGVEGEQLATVMSGLVHGFGFTEEQVGSLADKIYVAGKAFNAGREAIQAWPSIFEGLNEQLADFGKQLSPQEIEGLTLSIVQFGGALSESLGIPAQSAMEMARTMFTTLSGERKNIINMFRGMGGEFGDVARQLMETGGDVNKVFEMMATGDPLVFMDTLREMAMVAERQGGETGVAFQRLSGVMSDALGPDVAFAAKGNWDKVRGTLAQLPEVLAGPKAEAALKKAAKMHHKTGLTAGEAWERMVEGMRARLFKLSDKYIKGSWQKRMKTGFDDTFSVLEKLASDDGPVGKLTTRLLAVQRVGLSALIPGLEGLAPLLGGVMNSLFPMLTALGSMGLTFGSLGRMALGGGALWGLFHMLKVGPEKAIDQMKELGKQIWTTLGELFPVLKTKIEDFFDWFRSGDMGRTISGWFQEIDWGGIFRGIGDFLSKIPWGSMLDAALGLLKGLAGGLGRLIRSVFVDVDWKGLAVDVASFVWKAIKGIGAAIGALFQGIFAGESKEKIESGLTATISGALVGALGTVKNLALTALRGFWKNLFDADSVSGVIKNLVSMIGGGMAGLLILSKKFRGRFVAGFKNMFSGLARTTSGGWAGMVQSTKGGLRRMGKAIRTGMKAMGGVGLFFALFEAIDQIGKRGKAASEIMSSSVIKESEKAALAGEQAFMGVVDTIDALFLGIPGMIGNALDITRDDVSSFYHDLVAESESNLNMIVSVASHAWGLMKLGFSTFVDVAKEGWNIISNHFSYIIEAIKIRWQLGVNWIKEKVVDLKDSVTSILTPLANTLLYPFRLFKHQFKKWMSDFIDMMIGTKKEPTFVGKILRSVSEETFRDLRITSMESRLAWLKAGGEQFAKYQAEKDIEEKRRLREKFAEDRGKINKENLELWNKLAEAQSNLSKSNVASARKIGETVIGAAVEAGTSTQKLVDDVSDYTKDAQETADAAKKTSREMRDVAKEGEGVEGETGKGIARQERAGRKQAVPSAAERGEMVTPKDLAVRGLVHNVTTLTGAMTQFVKKPIDFNLKVEGDLGKFLRFAQMEERRTAPSPLAR